MKPIKRKMFNLTVSPGSSAIPEVRRATFIVIWIPNRNIIQSIRLKLYNYFED